MTDGLYTRHEVACIIADLLGNTCACDYSGNDEWLPYYCEFAETECPHPSDVACWEQYLMHKDKERREMTNKEAIEQLRERLAITDYRQQIPEYYEAIELAVEALEKQIPKKPLGGTDINGNKYKICRHCSAIVEDGEWRADYCPDCGQALDWSEERGE